MKNLTNVDRNLILRFLAGGAAAGTAAAATTSLLNHLNQLGREAKNDTSTDDDVLTVKMRRPRGQEKAAMMTGGTAVAGGVLSALGSAALLRKAYRSIKRKRLQEMLDASQVGFADAAAEEASKSAGMRGFHASDFVTAAPVASTLLLMLGSGVLANAYLNKTFPTASNSRKPNPRRVVFRYMDEDEQEKTASCDMDAGFEHMVSTILAHHCQDKVASDLSNLVAAVGEGRSDEVIEALALGANEALDLLKGASAHTPPDAMSVALAVRHPVLGPITKTLAALDWNDMSPGGVKMASTLPEDEAALMAALTCTVGEVTRAYNIKQASAIVEGNPEVAEELARVLAEQEGDPEAAAVIDGIEQNSGDAGVDANNAVQRSDDLTSGMVGDAAGLGDASAYDDIIDQIMGGSTPEVLPDEAAEAETETEYTT